MSSHSNTDLRRASKLIYENKNHSAPFLFSNLKISYTEALELINELEKVGVLGPFVENEEREILIKNLGEIDLLIPEEVENNKDDIVEFERIEIKFCQYCGLKLTDSIHNCNISVSIPNTTPTTDNSTANIDDVIESEVITHVVDQGKDVVKNNEKVSMFSSPFSFNGRIRRLEYGLSIIIFYAFFGLISVFSEEFPIIGLLVILAYWFLWAQGAKRCHDRGNSGWFQIIPFYGFWMLFAEGDIGDNEYGSNPKGINFSSNMSDNNPSEQQDSSSDNLSKGEF